MTLCAMRGIGSSARHLVLAVFAAGAGIGHAEVIKLRSGQVGGLPGSVGQNDDIMTWGASVGSGPLSASPFTAADYNNTISNPAVVIQPVGVWLPGLTYDTQARWVGTTLLDPTFPTGAPSSTLYRVPFTVSTVGITNAVLKLSFACDDNLGDILFGGANPVGAYLRDPFGNVTPITPAAGGGYAVETIVNFNITTAINTGLNELFLYQRDQGFGAAGLIFGARIGIVPAPGALAMVGLGGLFAAHRRRA
ncbi:MAG: PEP-CTERM sorting domain-containing protein [Phycisphaerales bacterium]|nr:PEP-CTERM sorting domain-containing protein [Phycisphaerales bacterium]